jgi:ribosomal protein S19
MRTIWKGPFVVAFSPQQLARASIEPIKTDARACTILPAFVAKKFLVHNGKSYVAMTVSEDMVGHRLGEFAATKKPAVFKVRIGRFVWRTF